jgi:hypothetical protein
MIPARYVGVRECDSRDPAVRTRLNVRDSDATLIISSGALTGGSLLTLDEARRVGRPVLHVDVSVATGEQAAVAIRLWLTGIRPEILNVAGPRASGDPRIGERAAAVLRDALGGQPQGPFAP